MKPATYRKRLEKKSYKQLLKIAVENLHYRIRERDQDKPCISCGGWHTLEAGHFYKAGSYANLRFDPLNISGQCVSCNHHNSGSENEYRNGLIKRYGKWIVEYLDLKAEMDRHNRGLKSNDRFNLIEIIMQHKYNSLPQITEEMATLKAA